MAKRLLFQSNFTSGELTPRLYGHVDVAKYKNGLKTATNCNIVPHGPVSRRSGSQYIASTKNDGVARLVRFQFSQDDAYVLEFGDEYIRFYKDQGVVLSLGSPYEIVSPYTDVEIFEFTYVQFGNTLYIAHENHPPQQLVRNGDTDWEISDIEFYPPVLTEDGVEPATTLTPAATTGTGITFTAGASVFLEGDVGRQLINLVGAGRASIVGFTSGTEVTADILEDFPNTSAIASGDWKMDLSPISELTPTDTKIGVITTITSDQIGTTTDHDVFRTGDVGKYIVMSNGIAEITVITNAYTVKAEIQKDFEDKDETSVWTLETEAWSADNGFPGVVTLHEQRLIFGGWTAKPQTIVMSESGIFDGFGRGTDDSDSIDVDLATAEVNTVSWMAGVRGELVVGTSGAELTINSGTSSGLTPTSVRQLPRTYSGSNVQQPVLINNEVLYIQRSGKKLIAFRYDFAIDNFTSDDLLFLSEHMAESGIKEVAYANDPDRHIYAVLNDGDMLVGTYYREQQILGWSRYQTDGQYESVQTISTGEHDEVWVVVNRTIDGATVRYVELFESGDGTERTHGFSDSFLVYSEPITISSITKASQGVVTATSHGLSNADDIKFVDMVGMTELEGITFTVSDATTHTFKIKDSDGNYVNTTDYGTFVSGNVHELVDTISNLDHLEGETVQVKADGALREDAVVESGAITLTSPAYEVVVGLEYETEITTLAREFDIGAGSMQGQQIRHVRPVIRVFDSALPLLNGEFRPARTPADRMDAPVSLFNGDVYYGPLTWDTSGELTFTFSDPLPINISAIFGAIDAGIK